MLTELLGEHVARARSCTEGVRHLELFYLVEETVMRREQKYCELRVGERALERKTKDRSHGLKQIVQKFSTSTCSKLGDVRHRI